MADDVEARVRVAEEELNLLKNQVQQTLLDVREHILDLVETSDSGIPRGDRPADAKNDSSPGAVGTIALPPTETGGGGMQGGGGGAGLGNMPGLDMGGGAGFVDTSTTDMGGGAGFVDTSTMDMGGGAGFVDTSTMDMGGDAGFGDMPGLDMGDAGSDTMPGADAGLDMPEAPFEESGSASVGDGFADAPFDDPGAGAGAGGGGGGAPSAGQGGHQGQASYQDQGAYPDRAEYSDQNAYSETDGDGYEYTEEASAGPGDAPEANAEKRVEPAIEPATAESPAEAGAPLSAPPAALDTALAEMDLVTLVGVVRWVDQAVQRIGQRRVDALLDVWQMTGRISEPTKDMIQTLCSLTHEDPDERVPLRDLVAMMIQMEAVLDTEESSNSRLLAMLFEEPGDPLSSLGALSSR